VAVSLNTIKRLFGESGNLCAFPKCSQRLITGNVVTGKVCHIKAQSPQGPRYDPAQSEEDRHGYNNLLLLCGVHHDVIDADKESYTVERLHQIKKDHLVKSAKLSNEDSERGSYLLFTQPVVSINQSGGITAASVIVNNFAAAVGQDESGKISASLATPFAEPREGAARFRTSDEPLGMRWEQIPILQRPSVDIKLAKGRAIWLRLIPTHLPQEDFGPLELKNAVVEHGSMCLQPLMNSNDLGYLISEDGIGIYNGFNYSNGITQGVAFAFVTGEVWGIDTFVLNLNNSIYFMDIAPQLIRRFGEYVTFLRNLGLKPPFRWIAGFEGISKMTLEYPSPPGFSRFGSGPICMSNTVADGGFYEETEEIGVTLGPLFDKLFKKCGSQRPSHLQNLTNAK
jgi:hypothetical protein